MTPAVGAGRHATRARDRGEPLLLVLLTLALAAVVYGSTGYLRQRPAARTLVWPEVSAAS